MAPSGSSTYFILYAFLPRSSPKNENPKEIPQTLLPRRDQELSGTQTRPGLPRIPSSKHSTWSLEPKIPPVRALKDQITKTEACQPGALDKLDFRDRHRHHSHTSVHRHAQEC